MESENTLNGICTVPPRQRHHQRRVTLWSLVWAVSYIAVTLAVKREWLTGGAAVAAAILTAVFASATLLAYRRFLHEADELRRKIELESLALAFGIGIIGGLTYWLLVEIGAAPGNGFSFVFGAMILSHAVGVILGRRRYS